MNEELFNRDSDTHMEHSTDDISNFREQTGFEEDLVEAEIIYKTHEEEVEDQN